MVVSHLRRLNTSSRISLLVLCERYCSVPSIAMISVSGKPSLPTHCVKYLSLGRCVQLKSCFSMIAFTISGFSKFAERKVTSGKWAFQVDSSGISFLQGPHPEYQTLTSHPLKTIFQHKACTDKLYADSFYKVQKNSYSSFEVICCRG